MGKYPKSKLHEAYSNWHWEHNDRLLQGCNLTDVDRIWVEIRDEQPKIVCDLKLDGDSITYSESILYDWLVKKGLPVFLLTPLDYDKENGIIERNSRWKVTRYRDGKTKELSCEDYCDWLRTFSIK